MTIWRAPPPQPEIGYGALVRGYVEVADQHKDRVDADWMRRRGLSEADPGDDSRA